jgi:hypothetical protein
MAWEILSILAMGGEGRCWRVQKTSCIAAKVHLKKPSASLIDQLNLVRKRFCSERGFAAKEQKRAKEKERSSSIVYRYKRRENTTLIYREKTILGETESHNWSLKPSTSAGARPPPRHGGRRDPWGAKSHANKSHCSERTTAAKDAKSSENLQA